MSGILMLPLLAVLYIGDMPLYLTGFILSILAVSEYSKAINSKGISKNQFNSIPIIVLLFLSNIFDINISFVQFFLYGIMFIFIFYIILKKDKINSVLYAIGSLYILLGFNAIALINLRFEDGNLYMWLIFIISILSDTMAYFTGSLLGKHKLAPTLSPKKTIEGSLGALVFSAIGCILFGITFNLNLLSMTILGVVGSIVSQVGDLIASLVKRYVGIKDYGNIIPGHGGILDRFDSIILVSQFIYFCLVLNFI